MNTNRGFTLIELLTVMAVMVIVASIIVTSAFGITKGASFTAAQRMPLNALEYAHQRACMDGRTTLACFYGDGDGKSLALFQAAGTVSGAPATSKKISDVYSDITKMTSDLGGGMLVVWNLDTGAFFVADKIDRKDGGGSVNLKEDSAADGGNNTYRFPITEIGAKGTISPSDWPKGSRYGFEIAERIRLPKDFSYSLNPPRADRTSGESFWIAFNPDGTSDEAAVDIVEAKTEAARKIRISVKDGEVSVEVH